MHCVVAGQRDGVHCAVNICECPHGVGSVGSSPAVGETTGHRDHHQLIVGSGKGSVIRRFTVFRQRNIVDLIALAVRDKLVVLGNLFGACDDPCVHAVRRFTRKGRKIPQRRQHRVARDGLLPVCVHDAAQQERAAAVNAAIVEHIIHQIAFLLADDEGDRGFRVIGRSV